MHKTAYPQHNLFIALGSNLEKPVIQLNKAVKALSKLTETHLLAVSPYYQSLAVGPQYQPNFLNAVAHLRTHLTPWKVLNKLQKIEYQQGRAKKRKHWGPRALDLDLLCFDEKQLNSQRLCLPHPQMLKRDFVLVPLRVLLLRDQQNALKELDKFQHLILKNPLSRSTQLHPHHYCDSSLRCYLVRSTPCKLFNR